MKKIIMIASLLPLLAACGGSKKSGNVDSLLDSPFVEEAELPDSVAPIVLTPDSLSSIHIGMDINSLPKSGADLYTNLVAGDTPDALTLTGMLDGKPAFTLYDFGEGKVDLIALNSDDYGVATPEGVLRIGDPFESLLKVGGVTTEWTGYDEGGQWFWKWGGLWFLPSEEGMTGAQAAELQNSSRPPKAADFAKCKIGYIGTGAPY